MNDVTCTEIEVIFTNKYTEPEIGEEDECFIGDRKCGTCMFCFRHDSKSRCFGKRYSDITLFDDMKS